MDFPDRAVVQRFVDRTVKKACDEVAEELRNGGVNAEVSAPEAGQVVLVVQHGEEIDFTYQVVATGHIQPQYAQSNTSTQEVGEEQKYYRAEVHLGEGGQDYDIMGWSKEGVINDIISQYHKHLHFLHSLR